MKCSSKKCCDGGFNDSFTAFGVLGTSTLCELVQVQRQLKHSIWNQF